MTKKYVAIQRNGQQVLDEIENLTSLERIEILEDLSKLNLIHWIDELCKYIKQNEKE